MRNSAHTRGEHYDSSSGQYVGTSGDFTIAYQHLMLSYRYYFSYELEKARELGLYASTFIRMANARNHYEENYINYYKLQDLVAHKEIH